MRPGAESGDVDVLRRQSCGLELIRVRLPEIDVPALAISGLEPPLDVLLGVMRAPERLHHFVADLATAHTQARANCGHEIFRAAAELALEHCNRAPHDRRDRAAPASMHGADDISASVGNEDGSTVRNPNCDGDIGVISNEGVGHRTRPRA